MKPFVNTITSVGSRRVWLALSVLAAILYNSWPLGYALDYQTARSKLASDLELAGRPYYWLFRLGDTLTAVCLLVVVLGVTLKFRQRRRAGQTKADIAMMTGLVLFGVFTALAALLPAQCVTLPLLKFSALCGGHGLSFDGITSSLAMLGLFIGLAGGLVQASKQRWPALGYTTGAVLAAWAASCLVFIHLVLAGQDAHFAEQVLIILCGAAVIAIGVNLVSIPSAGTKHLTADREN